jgi:hypothetical protein
LYLPADNQLNIPNNELPVQATLMTKGGSSAELQDQDYYVLNSKQLTNSSKNTNRKVSDQSSIYYYLQTYGFRHFYGDFTLKFD